MNSIERLNAADREENTIEILGAADREDIVSNLIASAIQQLPRFREMLLPGTGAAMKVVTKTRTSVPGVGNPDIVAAIDDKTLWIIENKPNAEEGHEQTARYADRKAVEALGIRSETPVLPEAISDLAGGSAPPAAALRRERG